jgi:hypothetical protein
VAAFGVVLAARDEDLLGLLEPVRVDQRLVMAFGSVPAVGPVAAAPLALGGLTFHDADDAVNDRLALELCEHAQHLHQHPPDGGGGVDGFGGRPERHTGTVELVDDLHQSA